MPLSQTHSVLSSYDPESRFPMTNDEMVEKARAAWKTDIAVCGAADYPPDVPTAMAEFARSAVRDALDRALTKIEAESFVIHDENGEYPAQRVVDIDDVRSVLQKREG